MQSEGKLRIILHYAPIMVSYKDLWIRILTKVLRVLKNPRSLPKQDAWLSASRERRIAQRKGREAVGLPVWFGMCFILSCDCVTSEIAMPPRGVSQIASILRLIIKAIVHASSNIKSADECHDLNWDHLEIPWDVASESCATHRNRLRCHTQEQEAKGSWRLSKSLSVARSSSFLKWWLSMKRGEPRWIRCAFFLCRDFMAVAPL